MFKKIVFNTFFSLVSAAAGLISTIYMAKNVAGETYSSLSYCILIVNASTLINIFKPQIFSQSKNKSADQTDFSKIFSSSLILSLALFTTSLLIFYKNNDLTVSLLFSTCAVLSLYSSIIGDDVEASGNVVYSSLMRNIFWLGTYASLLVITITSQDHFLLKSSAIMIAGLLLLIYSLLKKSPNFPPKNYSLELNIELLQHLKRSSKISLFNISSLILGSADRTFLSMFFGKTEFFHLYSIISDLFIKSHIFFRVASAVLLSELSNQKISEAKSRIKIAQLTTAVSILILFLAPIIKPTLATFNIENHDSYRIAIFYAASLIPISAGYLSAAIAYSRGDSNALIVSYFPISLLFLITSYFACKFLTPQVVIILYLLSRFSDILLMHKVGFGKANIFYTMVLTSASLLLGWFLWI